MAEIKDLLQQSWSFCLFYIFSSLESFAQTQGDISTGFLRSSSISKALANAFIAFSSCLFFWVTKNRFHGYTAVF